MRTVVYFAVLARLFPRTLFAVILLGMLAFLYIAFIMPLPERPHQAGLDEQMMSIQKKVAALKD